MQSPPPSPYFPLAPDLAEKESPVATQGNHIFIYHSHMRNFSVLSDFGGLGDFRDLGDLRHGILIDAVVACFMTISGEFGRG